MVADSLTGQDAVETAQRFHERLPLTGIVLTRADGDGRGGAALSMRAVTGLPIKFLGIGEKIDGIDTFDAHRIAGRILGQGDVVAVSYTHLDVYKRQVYNLLTNHPRFKLTMWSKAVKLSLIHI